MTKQFKHWFPVPREIFAMELSPGEIALYSYLMFLEDRKTYTCYPSYQTIGKAIQMSKNTVAKYVKSLEDKILIETERTRVYLKNGKVQNGNLKYKILPIQTAYEQHIADKIANMPSKR